MLLLSLTTPALAWQTSQTQQPPTQQTPPAQPPTTQSPPATPPASTPTTQTPPPTTPPATPAQPKPADPTAPTDPTNDRIFGVMPNYTTVVPDQKVPPITAGASFKMAALDSFDPMVYPLFGFIAGVSQLQNTPEAWGRGWKGYSKRYGAAFADNTVCSLVTTGLMPSLLRQDPRYYQGRATGFFPRLGYAAKSSLVTRSRTGHKEFNLSEVGGTLVVANISNLYYPQDERNVVSTLERWGTQAMWDTIANELKEFWPDIKRMLHGG